ncbi:MAG: phosphomannomutase [Pseudonocardiales bacterium]|nr:MAG: phosphomannomutase [Pseudonocardiales bacterium]
MISVELRAQVQAWIGDEVDPAAAAELSELLQRDDEAELTDRFSGPLTFGTAGLRGPLRAGPNGMNRTVVRRAAAGVAAWLTAQGHTGAPVVVGYDGRHGSHDFARDSAAILAAAGLDARLLPRLLPTPLVAFAVQYLGAAAGVMVTASHNPPEDNGYKVYAADGAQIVPPTDTEIEAAIRAVGRTREILLAPEWVSILDESLVDAYVSAVAGLIDAGPRDARIVHTAMHGVGTEVVRKVFTAAGFAPLIAVPQQEQPDADFPTVAFPNPEEPGALDLAYALAREQQADVIVANDPDADRCAVAVPVPGRDWRMLRGDEVGVLLADSLLRKGIRGTYATTIVSSTMLQAMAERNGVGYAETLTGFKWISRAAPDLVFGYEEALGYAVAPELVRDKDGISAALLVAELAATLKSQGSSLLQRLDELAREYGRYATDQAPVRVDDVTLIGQIMSRLRAGPPATLLGQPVTVTDLLPDADVVRLTWPSGRVVVRPSGTEPKLKVYLEVVVPDGSAATAASSLTLLHKQISAALGI